MSELIDLVPPLELCYHLKLEDFEDSIFVWAIGPNGKRILVQRNYSFFLNNEQVVIHHEGIPAPIMAEILEALKAEDHEPSCFLRGGTIWCVDGVGVCKMGHKFPPAYDAVDLNHATAALKLWLDIEGGK